MSAVVSPDARRRSLKSKALQLLAQRDQSRVELRRKLLAHARKVIATRGRGGVGADGNPEAAVQRGGERADSQGVPAGASHADASDAGTSNADTTEADTTDAEAAGAESPRADVAEADAARRADAAEAEAAETEAEEAGAFGAAAEVDAVLAWLDAHRFLSDERFAESRVHAREARFGNLRIRHELGQHAVKLSADAERALAASELQRAFVVCERKFPRPPSSLVERASEYRFLAARGFSPDVIRRAVRERAAAAQQEKPHEEPLDDAG